MAKQQKNKRDDFPPKVVEALMKRAANRCSKPSCRILTTAPSPNDENKFQYFGVAAHITAASEGGPRFDPTLSNAERQSIRNAIFLCSSCSVTIDKNGGIDYPVDVLKVWKEEHEKWILGNLNKSSPDLPFEDSKRDFDKSLFAKANEYVDENLIEYITEYLVGDESIFSNDIQRINSFRVFLSKASSRFFNEKIESSKMELIDSLKNLSDFIGANFFVYPDRQIEMQKGIRLCMRPDLNCDRGGTGKKEELIRHDLLSQRLKNCVFCFENCFLNYRLSVRESLFI